VPNNKAHSNERSLASLQINLIGKDKAVRILQFFQESTQSFPYHFITWSNQKKCNFVRGRTQGDKEKSYHYECQHPTGCIKNLKYKL
jgi:hypothetical protein